MIFFGRSQLSVGVLCIAIGLPLLCAAPAASQAPPSSWDLSLALRVGSLDGENAFGALNSIIVSPATGNAFVAESSTRILAFDSAGKRVSSFGRRGSGPGEFQNLAGISWSNGKVVAFDAIRNQVSSFDETGRLIESFQVVPDSLTGRWIMATPVAPLGRTGFATVARRETSDEGMLAYEVGLFRTEREGTSRIMDQFLDKGRWFSVGSGRMVPIPSTGAEFAVGPFGEMVVVVHQPEPERETAARFQMRIFGRDGQPLLNREYSYSPAPIPDEYLSEFIDSQRNAFTRMGLSLRQVEKIIGSRMWRYYPPVSKVTVGADSSIWLQLRPVTKGRAWWWVLDAQGEPRGRVFAPAGLDIQFASADDVWGVEKDAYGINYLVRYAIDRH